jgi:TolB-like protein/Flp pilus assembly protein TadD
MASIWGELKRRNVVRVGIAYAIVAWLLIEVTTTTFPLLNLPTWAATFVTVLLLLGFPVAIIFAWAFELTPEGIKKEKDVDRNKSITKVTGRKLDFVIIGVLVIAVGFLLVDKLYLASREVVSDEITATERQSIAVLPFVNMSTDPEQEYFSDGLTEELLNLLARIPELRVISRTSAFFYKGKDFRIADVGRELNVDHVLEGSVRRSGDQIRITAQLIDVSDDSHVWSDTWDRTLDDVFVVQDEIAQAVIGGLKIRLLDEAPKAQTTSPEAYSLYLQSQAVRAQFTAVGHRQAKALVLRALEIDNTYVPALLLLARTHLGGSATGAWHPHEGYPKGRAAIMEALRLDPASALAHAELSRIASNYDYDMETARKEMELALTLDPHDYEVLNRAAGLATIEGDFDEAIRLTEMRQFLDPISWGPKLSLGNYRFLSGRPAEAISAYNEALELLPLGSQINFRLGSAMLVSGELNDALSHFNRETRDGFRLAGRAMVFHAMGDTESANSELEKLIAIGDTWTYEIAQVHAYFGNLDESFRWLHRAIDRRDQSFTLFNGDPFMENIRDDSRYDEVLERLGRSNPR